MSTTVQSRAAVLFLDDDPRFLELMQRIMSVFSEGRWEILTAESAGEALGLLQNRRIDMVVIDVQMPVVDGLQFLSLLNRKHPNLMKVVLTAYATNDAYRAACLGNGAELFLEKPKVPAEQQSLYAALNELIKWRPDQGFQGVLRRVGLHDVIQMECLSRHSTILEVRSGRTDGRIYLKDGGIIHASSGSLKGELAFNQLLTLKGGDFQFLPFTEPPEATIDGSWEFLLMEAARARDESESAEPKPPPAEPEPLPVEPEFLRAAFQPPAAPCPPPTQPAPDFIPEPAPAETPETRATPTPAAPCGKPPAAPEDDGESRAISEMLICSAEGDVLYEWRCPNADVWIHFFEFISRKARQLTQGLNSGPFDRLQFSGGDTRVVARVSGRQGVLVRSSGPGATQASALPLAPAGPDNSNPVTGIDERSRALLKEWLLSFPRSEGFLALGLRFPNKTSLSESFDRSFPLPALEQTWRGVADTFKVLDLHRLPAERMLWRYRDLWLAAVRRPDGCTLSLVISSQAASALTHQTGQLQDAFLALGR